MIIDRLQRSRRKTVALYVHPDGSLEVRAPLRLSSSAIQAFVDSKSDWVLRQRKKLISQAPIQPRDGYAKGDSIWFLGGILSLNFITGYPCQIKIEGDCLLIPAKLQNNLGPALTAWYRLQSRHIISARIGYFSNRYGFRHNGIRITSARSRWGSCGSNNHLNFPYRLVMAPLDIIDYIVVHELCHLREPNHSSRFWRLVESRRPGWRRQRAWLQ